MTQTKTGRRGYFKQLASRLEEGAGEFMKTWKTQAKRPDRVGDVTYGGLELVHGGFSLAVRSLTRLERATQLPHRAAKPEPPAPVKAPVEQPVHPVAVHRGKRPVRPEPAPTRS
jgi:hypothetical protein